MGRPLPRSSLDLVILRFSFPAVPSNNKDIFALTALRVFAVMLKTLLLGTSILMEQPGTG